MKATRAMAADDGAMLVSLPDGYHLHGFLTTGLAWRLVDSGHPVTFLVPPGARRCVEPNLAAAAEWIEFPMQRLPSLARIGKHLRLEASHYIRRASSWDIIRAKHVGGRLRKIVQAGLGRLLAACPRLETVISAAESLQGPSPLAAALDAGRYRTVVFGSSGIKDLDMAVMRLFRGRDVRRYGIAYSWDNISSKFNCFSRLDRLAVWNEIMKCEAACIPGLRQRQVAVVGPAQFDCYFDFAPPRSREAFLHDHGLPAGARYVLYAAAHSGTTPWNAEYVECITEAVADRHVIVRSHPQEAMTVPAALGARPRVHLVDAGQARAEDERRLGFWVPRPNEGSLLAEQIYHADVVVTLASTITLEGLCLDRPVVNIAFDIESGTFAYPMARYFQTQHYRVVTQSGAVRIVESRQQLADAVRDVGAWWPHCRENRDALNRRIDPFGDGRAAERLADDILAFHHDGNPPAGKAS